MSDIKLSEKLPSSNHDEFNVLAKALLCQFSNLQELESTLDGVLSKQAALETEMKNITTYENNPDLMEIDLMVKLGYRD